MTTRLSALLFAAIALLAGCEPDVGDPGAPNGAGDPTTATPVSGGSLVVGVYGEPATFDPFSLEASDLTHALTRPLYRSLYRFDENGEPVPDLARRMRTSADLATIALDDARWSDGARITARDVAASLRRAAAAGLIEIDSVRRSGRTRVALAGRVDDWEQTLARMSYVLPYDGRRAFSGPFVLRSQVDGLQMVLERNRQAAQPPLLDRVIIRFTEGTDMLMALLEVGDLDVAAIPSTVNLGTRLAGSGLHHDEELGWEMVVVDLSDSDLAHPQRRAVARALDRAKIAEGFVRDDGRVIDTLTPVPGEGGAAGPYESFFRGAADVDDVALRVAAPSGDELLELTQRLAQVQLTTAGFDVELINVDARRFYGEWGRVAPVDAAIRRRSALPGSDGPSPRSLVELPLFQVDSFLAWRDGVGGIEAGTVEGPLASAHEWHLLP